MTDLPAGPELDRLIAEKVMGWEHDGLGYSIDCGKDYRHPFNPSINIAHAWEVVEKLDIVDHEFTLLNSEGIWECGWRHYRLGFDSDWERSDSATAPLAICRAALRAIGHQ